jgi:hypothetical protein
MAQSGCMSPPASFSQFIAAGLATLLIVLPSTWGVFALWYQFPGNQAVKSGALLVWLCLCGGVIFFMWQERIGWSLLAFFAVFALMLLWWSQIPASNERRWADDVARTAYGAVDGSRITLHNVRNFDWRTADDYTQRWETRNYDLDHLDSVDMIMSYWAGPAIAHMLISFGFDDGQHVVFSVEIRREKTEEFSEVGGFFKEFELSVIAADELDVVRLRTNVRGEDDYLYRLRIPVAAMRSLFLAYVDEANRLYKQPRFYNTITVNCTTLVYHMMKRIVGHLPLDYRLLLSGYLPEYVYRVRGLDQRFTLAELKSFGRITERAKASDREHFSEAIRRGVPVLTKADLPSGENWVGLKDQRSAVNP